MTMSIDVRGDGGYLPQEIGHHDIRAILRDECAVPILTFATALVADGPDHRMARITQRH